MPTLPMHIKIANRLKEKHGYSTDFIIGNLIPDICYQDKDNKPSYSKTHYSDDQDKIPSSDIHKFLFENGNNLNNEVVLGTFVHILTDNYFNKYIEAYHLKQVGDTRYAILANGRLCTDQHPMKLKHQDYEIFSHFLANNNQLGETISITDTALEKAKQLAFPVEEDDLNYVINIINDAIINHVEDERSLELLSKNELLAIMEGCYLFIDEHMNRWEKIGIINGGKNVR